ncbi:MAG: hypothetical protein FH749_00450 [Firmicutes bacterium]|nr:hypothetical protein [Bacillota bacterium]
MPAIWYDDFVDNRTAEQIGLAWIWQRFQTLSCYGDHLRRRLRPYGPGQERQLQEEWALVRRTLEDCQQKPSLVKAVEMDIHQLREIRGLVGKSARGMALEEFELFEFKQWLSRVASLAQKLNLLTNLPPRLELLDFSTLAALLSVGEQSEQGFYLSDQYLPELAELRARQRKLQSRLNRLRRRAQAAISAETGVEFNFMGVVRVSKLEGKLLEELRQRDDLILAAEGFTDVEFRLRESGLMLTISGELAELETGIQQEELAVRLRLSKEVARYQRQLLAVCRRLGSIDLLFAKIRLARETGWTEPILSKDNHIELRGFTHPAIANYLQHQGLEFQPVDIDLSTKVTLITGANMGGKSVSLKSAGLAVAMAQLGLLVPADKLVFSLRGFVYYSQQDASPEQGLSTFGAEVYSLAGILPRYQERGLMLLDEPARGTNPAEGTAIVGALVDWLRTGNSLVVVSTHYQPRVAGDVNLFQVAGLAALTPAELNAALKENKSVQELMDYSLVPGSGQVPRDALKVAAFLGLDKEIIDSAARELGVELQEVTNFET